MAGDVGGSASATKFTGTPAQNTATGTPPAGVQSAMQGLGAMGNNAGMNSNMGAGGKGGGGMQPQQTAMGTPIVYGKSYLPNPVSGQPNAGVPVTPTYDTSMDGGGGDGGFADGTMSVPAYAYGTESVAGYAYGTESVANYARGTMEVDDDPWSWTNQQPIAPLSADIKPSNEQPGPRVADPVQQQLGSMAMSKGIDATEKGINAAYQAYGAPLATNAIGSIGTTTAGVPVALGNVGAVVAPSAVTLGTPIAGALAPVGGAGLSTLAGGAGTGLAASSAAPIGASLGTALGAVAPVATTAGTAATTAGLGSALGAGGTAMMGALASNPVGWAIGAGLLAKKLKII
jgi:hypothetical protein